MAASASTDSTCLANTKRGSRCTRPGVKEGYCLQHYDLIKPSSSISFDKIKLLENNL